MGAGGQKLGAEVGQQRRGKTALLQKEAGELRLGLASNYMQRYEEYLERRVHGVPEESD